MQKQLAKGVVLNVIPTSQFKTISITVDFLAPGDVSSLSKQILLAQLLETSSEEYPTQTDLAEKLSMMYGASYGVNVFRYGYVEGLRVSSTIINDHFIGGQSLLADIFNFLKSVIYRPLTKGTQFDPITFERQKQNLVAYLRSLNDDKQYYAEQQLNQLYFQESPFFATSLYGDATAIDSITSETLLTYYQQLLATHQIQVTVAGDVDAGAVADALANWQIIDRDDQILPVIYRRPASQIVEKTEEQQLQQSKLNLAYHLPIYYREADFYKAIVFNGIFGGTPISMLFKNVREKNSLAYYASSRFDGFSGSLFVQTGIDQANENRVKQLIGEQLSRVAAGDFEDELFDQVVASLINNRESRLDSPRALVNQAMVNQLVGQTVTAEEWVTRIKQVTKQDVADVAKRVTLQAGFFLRGVDAK